MTFPGTAELQPKSSSKANFLSFWSRSWGRRRRASLLLKFRKVDFLPLKRSVFCSISRCKKPESLVFRVDFKERKGRKWRILRKMCHFSVPPAPEPDQCATGESTKKSGGSVQWIRRLEARKRPVFRAKISEFSASDGQ